MVLILLNAMFLIWGRAHNLFGKRKSNELIKQVFPYRRAPYHRIWYNQLIAGQRSR